MSKTYNIIRDLCKEKGTSISKMCAELGISRSLFAELKSGRTKKLSASTLEAVAGFFNVPIDYLLDLGEPNPKDIPPEPKLTDEELMFALWKDNPNNMTKEDLEKVISFARYLEQEKGGSD